RAAPVAGLEMSPARTRTLPEVPPMSLQGRDRLANKANPAAEAQKTEYARAGFTPVPTHMPRANRRGTMPLARPAPRGRRPSTRPTPRTGSAAVASQASTGITAGGGPGLSCAVEDMKCAKAPQPPLRAPGGPHTPNRSATAERNAVPSASLKYTETNFATV